MARSHSLDNLRTYLTVVVLLHHTSLPYGGIGSWSYKSSSCSYPPTSSITIASFNALNQTFFMALFFLLSGYFSALSSRKRSRKVFLKDKWKRLAVPTLLYSFLGSALVRAILAGVRDGKTAKEVLGVFWKGMKSVRGVNGPVWYCATLLVFDVLYTLLQPGHFGSDLGVEATAVREPLIAKNKNGRMVSTTHVLLALATTSAASFFIRIYYPIGTTLWPLSLNLGYLPQYALFYVHGVRTARTLNTELHCSFSRGTLTVLVLIAIGVTAFGSGFAYRYYDLKTPGNLAAMMNLSMGSLTPIASIYALWNEVTGAAISAALLLIFNSKFESKWSVYGLHLARYSYSAFLTHALIVVFLQSLADSWCAESVLKTALLGTIAVVGSWGSGVGLVNVVEGLGCRGYI
jgi:glucan biosynthesis protein C